MKLNPKNTFFVLLIGLFVSYSPIIFKSQIVNPDAQVVILYLDQLSGLIQYFKDLINLHTVDFQPVRDLSLYLDLIIYKKLGINIAIFINVLVWFLACLNVEKIISKIAPRLNSNNRRVLVILFSLYPLFSTTIAWGIARKHLLSFLFINLATTKILNLTEEKIKKNLYWAAFFYILAILAQPINLLWAVWAVIYLKIKWREKFYQGSIILLPPFLFITYCNWIYYNHSPVFKTFYNSKTEDISEIVDKILAIGHYAVQLIFPNHLTFIYPLGDIQQIIGIGVFVLLVYFAYKTLKEKISNLWWLFFTISPLLIILNTPKLLIDSYLLTPALGCLIVLSIYLEKIEEKIGKKLLYIFIPISIFFIYLDFNQANDWGDKVSFTKSSFHARSSCDSAKTAARVQYEEEGKLDDDIREYLESFDCLRIPKGMTLSQVMIFIRLNTFIIYYSEDLSLNQKVSALDSMSNRSAYPKLIKAALYAKFGEIQKVEEIMAPLKESDFVFKQHKTYDRIVVKDLNPFCQKNKLAHCLDVVKNMIYPSSDPWM